ncbi:helix-turn-helix domain-containing protein [Candidatus Poribacteria bacterium]|nr:helix-turn-helix domain-containing protein [Candidatus Poribacteria bacterium]
MTQAELAARTGLARKTINGIINGKEPIPPETAIQFEMVFRVPASFWLNLQKNFEETSARLRECK